MAENAFPLTVSNRVLSRAAAQAPVPPTSFTLTVLVPVYNERHVVDAALRRVLALEHPLIRELEIIVVDDCSTDGTGEVLRQLAAEDNRIKLIRHERNMGKGAGLRTAIGHASGDVCVVQDADFEYNPADIPALLLPFAEEGADAVFGSRYLSASYRRALMYRHTLMNKAITSLGNWFTDLHLTDLETGYKAINTTLLKSIPIRSNDFRFEVEITFKLAKRGARIFEVPIRYLPRTREEGKKIGAWDGVLALLAMLRWTLVDDMFEHDEYGSRLLSELERARRFTLWLGRTIRPYVGSAVLEIGAGVASITHQFIPRDLYVTTEANPHYLRYLRSYALGKPYLHVLEFDPGKANAFSGMEEQFDTVMMLNVLESLPDPDTALRGAWSSLKKGGGVIVQVPQYQSLYGTLDQGRGRRRRFSRAELEDLLQRAGFAIAQLRDFNSIGVPGWWLNSKILRRDSFSRIQLKALDTLLPLLRRIDGVWPWGGLSLLAIGRKS